MDDSRLDPDTRLIAKELQLELSSTQRTLYFHGESMRPFLVEGDEVVVEPVEWDAIRPGDVITYRYLERFPTRRVMRKSAAELQLWCENWPDRSFQAGRDDILGRAVARRRGEEWLHITDLAWKSARIKARSRWRLRQLIRVDIPRLPWRVRWAVGRFLRRVGLRAPLPPK
jgi:signal peptidase I